MLYKSGSFFEFFTLDLEIFENYINIHLTLNKYLQMLRIYV